MDDLRILTVIPNLGRGGAEQALVNLLPALVALGHRCDVAALYPPYDLAGDLEGGGVGVHRLDLGHRWDLARGVPRLAGLCRRGGYDVVHAHLFFAGVYAALSRPFARGAVRVVTFHNLGYDSYPADTAWRKVRKRIDSALMRRAIDGRVAVSGAVAGHYAGHLGLPPIETIPNAFPVGSLAADPVLDRAAVLSGYGLGPEDFVLLFCGRMVHEKGHRFFLKALDILRGRGAAAKALIVGDGPGRAEVAGLVEGLGLGGLVRASGPVPHGELLRLVQAADLYVMASTHEGFPLGPAEAMALGRPVVATAVGGIPDLIVDGESGLLVPPGDPGALADAIGRAIADGCLRGRLGRLGRRRIEDHFSAGVVAARWVDYYRALIAASGGRGGA